MNIESLVINRVVRGTLFDKSTGEVIFTLDNIANPSLECSGEQVFATDALGQNIAAFDRSKSAKFSGENALFNFGLMAAQLGSDKKVGTEQAKITVPKFQLIEVTGDGSKITLAEEPVDTSLKFIYSTFADKSKDTAYARATDASPTQFSILGKEITLPTGVFKAGDRIAVWYEVEKAEAQEIKNTTTKFAKGGKFVLEVLVAEPCDVNKEYYAYVIFSNAKLDNNTTMNFTTDSTHAFTINAMQDYCSTENELFSIVLAA